METHSTTTIIAMTTLSFPLTMGGTVRKYILVVPAVFAGITFVRKTKILTRIVYIIINLGTLWTTIIIAMTTVPLPIPDRKIIGRVPAVFVIIIVVLKTIILTRIVQVRGRRWSGWRCGWACRW